MREPTLTRPVHDEDEGEASRVRPRATRSQEAPASGPSDAGCQNLELVGSLAAGVAHDLNNVFMVLSACAEEIRTTLPSTHPAREALYDLLSSIPQGHALTKELLLLARGKATTGTNVGLNALVLDTGRTIRRLASERISVVVVADPAVDPVQVRADTWLSILTNLVLNAHQAMPDGGTLTLRTHLTPAGPAGHPAHAELFVEDTGAGFDTETAAKIFTPFFTTKANGTGLGLANVKRNVEAAGGSISFQSRPGVGTTFRIALAAG